MYKEIFSVRIKDARKKAGYTQIEVAQETNISRSVISRYETGVLEPNIENIGTLAEFYGVSTDWLFGIGAQSKNTIQKETSKILNDLEKEARREKTIARQAN